MAHDLFPEKTIETLKRFDSLNLPKSRVFLSRCFLHPRLDTFMDNLRERSHVFSSLFQNHQKAHTTKHNQLMFFQNHADPTIAPHSVSETIKISAIHSSIMFSFISLANHGKLSNVFPPHLSKKRRWSRW